MTDPSRETELLARLDEAEALISSLRDRLTVLNVEIRLRDAALEDLRAEKGGSE
jgi:hypothetical protein